MSLFILELVFFVSFGIIVFLFVRKLPQVGDLPKNSGNLKKSFEFGWIDRVDHKVAELLSKWLRKIKLVVMRLDNYVTGHIERMKQRHSVKLNQQNILKEIDKEEAVIEVEKDKEEKEKSR